MYQYTNNNVTCYIPCWCISTCLHSMQIKINHCLTLYKINYTPFLFYLQTAWLLSGRVRLPAKAQTLEKWKLDSFCNKSIPMGSVALWDLLWLCSQNIANITRALVSVSPLTGRRYNDCGYFGMNIRREFCDNSPKKDWILQGTASCCSSEHYSQRGSFSISCQHARLH